MRIQMALEILNFRNCYTRTFLPCKLHATSCSETVN